MDGIDADVLKQLGEIKGSIGRVEGLLVGVQGSLTAGAARMDNHEDRLREVEKAVSRYAGYAAIGGTILAVVAQQIMERLF